MSAYKRCPKLYQYSMVEHRRRKGATESPSLNYGSVWHAGLDMHYRHPQCDIDELEQHVQFAMIKKWELPIGADDYRTLDRAHLEYAKYLKQFGLPWNEEAKTVGWPQTPMVELAVEMPVPGARHPYVGKVDRIYRTGTQHYIEDHKTTSRFDTNYFRQWETDDQMIGYATLAGIMIGEPIIGVRINLHVIRKNDSVFERRIIPFARDRIKYWEKNYDVWLGRIEADMEGFRNNSEWAFPENFSACAGKYGMCTYAGVCTLTPAVRRIALEQDFPEVNPWNPLEADEDSDAA